MLINEIVEILTRQEALIPHSIGLHSDYDNSTMNKKKHHLKKRDVNRPTFRSILRDPSEISVFRISSLLPRRQKCTQYIMNCGNCSTFKNGSYTICHQIHPTGDTTRGKLQRTRLHSDIFAQNQQASYYSPSNKYQRCLSVRTSLVTTKGTFYTQCFSFLRMQLRERYVRLHI